MLAEPPLEHTDALIEPEQQRHNRLTPPVVDRLGLSPLHPRPIRPRRPGPSHRRNQLNAYIFP